MYKFLLSFLFFTVLVFFNTKAQSPNISYSGPQTLYLGKPATSITVNNTGGSIPAKLYPQSISLVSGANLLSPRCIVKTSSGDFFVIAGSKIYRFRTDGTYSVFAGNNNYATVDGTGASASFQEINGIDKDAFDNLYVTESNGLDAANCKIRKITPTGVVTTYASELPNPHGITVTNTGIIYISTYAGKIMKVTADGTSSLLAGQNGLGKADGIGANASFYNPGELVTDQAGNIFVNDSGNSLIRKITPDGTVTTFAGSGFGSVDGIGTNAKFSNPADIIFDSKGNLIVTDGSGLIRKVTPSALVTTIAQPPYYDDQNRILNPSYPTSITLDENDNIVYFNFSGLYKLLITGFSISPLLPAGLTFGTDGSISGTPTTLSTQQTYTIKAQNSNGLSSATIDLQVVIPPDPPIITSFTPVSAPTNGYVTITGSYFTGTTSVTIGGKPVSSFTVLSPTSISAYVASGASSGDVTVTNSHGTASLSGFTFIPPPVITSFIPTSGGNGTLLTITGTGFTGVIQVLTGGYSTSFTVVSPTQIQATVGSTGATGDISVNAINGGATLPGFTYINSPSISNVSPALGGAGTTITINGANFSTATSVKFGTIEASSFNVVSPTQITAVIANGSSNGITVTTAGGSTSYSNFTYIPPPTINMASPLKGGYNSVILITGANLSGAQVMIGGVPAAVRFNSANQVSATVGSGAASGSIQVVTGGGSAALPGFIWVPAPVISSFSPQTAAIGDVVTITGTDLTEVDNVSFGGVNSTFTVLSPSTIQATVGYGASGAVTVVSEGGSSSLNGFVHSGPAVTSFLPTQAGAGETVTINGSNFTGITEVDFGGVPATSFTINSPTQITAVVGQGKSGNVTVINPSGSGVLAGFTHKGPSITSFSPVYAGPLSSSPIIINGANFTGATGVTFGGVPAASFTVLSATSISAVPSNTAASGDVAVTSAQGLDKKTGFTWVQPPSILSISPASQKNGGVVTITGTNFTGVSSVKFGDIPALNFFAGSATTLTATVGLGASGDVTVSTVGGTATISGFTYTSPAILSVSPLTAAAAQTITITGTNLDAIQNVNFGGVAAASFSIVSPGTITAVLGAGHSGNITITGPTGSGSFPGFVFVSPPVISSVTPNLGGAGTEISISGLNFTNDAVVKVGGVPATIISSSVNLIKATLGSGATGKISVTTIAGTTEFDGFTWYPAPTITSASPLTAGANTTVTITGTNFTGLTQLKFGSSPANFTIVSPTQLTVQPINGSSDSITITGPGGTASLAGFNFIPAPVITAFSTTGEGQNATVTVTGSNFNNVSDVQFGGVSAQSYIVVSPNSITASLGAGATGSITVTTSGGTGTITGFLYKKPPSILSFSPANGPIGTTVTLTGDNFNTIPAKNIVSFGPVKAQVINATQTQLQVIVPAGANELITVLNVDKALSANSNLPFVVTNTSGFTGFANKFSIPFELANYAINDFDEDGQPDLLISKSDSLYILRHGSDPVLSRSSFSQKIVLETGRTAVSLVVGDLDGDGKKDILYSIGTSLVVLHNTSSNANITFSQTVLENINNINDSMVLRDMDMDGLPDLVVASGMVYPNTTKGSVISFGPSIFLANTSSSSNISFALTDIDGDNKPEPVLGSSYKGISLFQNNSVPGSITAPLFPITYFSQSGYNYTPRNIITADFDGDSKPDIAENSFGYNQFLVSKNVSVKGAINTSSFNLPLTFLNTSMFQSIAAADIDGDGKVDVFGSSNTDVYYSKNTSSNGNIVFNNPIPLVINASANSVTMISANDMDGDGRMDIISLDGDQNKLTIYNNGPIAVPKITTVTPLTAATGTVVTITGKYLDATTAVNFGSQSASSFKVVSPDTITAVVGIGESGNIAIQNPDGPATFSGFKFIPPPVITSAVAAEDGSGLLTITGNNLSSATIVSIAGTPAISFNVNSDNNITATFTAISGTLSINTAGGTATLGGITIKTKPTIHFTALPAHIYGDDDFTLDAVSSNTNVPVMYSVDNKAISTIQNGQLHITGAGTVTISASQASDSLHTSVIVTQILTINKKMLQVKADDLNRVYGEDNPTLTVAYNGFSNGDNASNLTTLPSIITAANVHSSAGTYDIAVDGAMSNNYTFNYIKGTLTINKAVLNITAADASKAAGKPNPDFTIIYNGFINGDDSGNLLTKPVITTAANNSSPIGIYDLVPSGANADNYTFIYNNGKLIITPAINNFMVAANSVTCKGENNGSININSTQTDNYTAVITGSGLDKSVAFTTNTTIDNLSPGTYNVCISTASLVNYNQCFELIVTEPKDLSVYATIDKNAGLLNLALNGGSDYEINFNGNRYSTTNNSIKLPLKRGRNNLSVSTDKVCQGTIEKTIDFTGNQMPYPNPFLNVLYINLGALVVNTSTVKIYSVTNGTLLITKLFSNQSGIISLDVSQLGTGVYSLHLITDTTETVYKILKK